jgi:hypothetical protein
MATVEDITVHLLVQQVLTGVKRLLAHKPTKKEPITLEYMVERFSSEEARLADVRAMAAASLGEYDSFLFKRIIQTKNGSKLRSIGGLSYNTVHETVIAKLEEPSVNHESLSGYGVIPYQFTEVSHDPLRI